MPSLLNVFLFQKLSYSAFNHECLKENSMWILVNGRRPITDLKVFVAHHETEKKLERAGWKKLLSEF